MSNDWIAAAVALGGGIVLGALASCASFPMRSCSASPTASQDR